MNSWQDKLSDLITDVWRWLRTSRHVMLIATLACVAVLLLGVLTGYHLRVGNVVPDRAMGDEAEPQLVQLYDVVGPYFKLVAELGSVLYMLCLIRVWPRLQSLVLPTLIACAFLAGWALVEEWYGFWEAGATGFMGEPRSVVCFIFKVILMVSAIISPVVMLAWYSRQMLLDRYTLKTFAQPFIFCLVAIAALWVLIDMINNLKEFQESGIGFGTILKFYFNLAPYIYVIVCPLSLLLAVLYALTRMSRANELVSMLTAGRSLAQVLRPVFIFSIYACFLGMVANYHWAPRGEARRDSLIQTASSENSKKVASIAKTAVMYRNDAANRVWYVGAMPFDPRHDPVQQVEVRQFDDKGHLLSAWFGRTARWYADPDPAKSQWMFTNGLRVEYDRHYTASTITPYPKAREGTRLYISAEELPETPWDIISASLSPDNLGVSELVSFISADGGGNEGKSSIFNTHLFQRFALPWQGLVLMLLAAPMAVSFSRRGALGGIAGAMGFFFLLLFLNNFFFNLGKGGHFPSWLTVWMPHLIIGTAAFFVFRMRNNNEDLPKFQPMKWLSSAVQAVQQFRGRRKAVS